MQREILKIALPTPLRRYFDYLPPQDIDLTTIKPGVRVKVPFQSRFLVGILISIEKNSTLPYDKLKRADIILDEEPILSEDVYKLCLWAANYYHYALGEVLMSALPAVLRKAKPIPTKKIKIETTKTAEVALTLNAEQKKAVLAITNEEQFKTFLLDGVTGSGKTEVYLQAIATIIQKGGQVLVLVPEISLTPQTISRFRKRFTVPVLALHSGMTDNKRVEVWAAAKSGFAKIVIGTRSAIFTPFQQLKLIIVDEEHDTSFKQQDRFRYHARDLAIMRASINHIPIVLGSATPSLESLLNVKKKRYDYLQLPNRAGLASLPQYHLIDLQTSTLTEGISSQLIAMMKEHLAADNQVMLFLNRRGFAPVLYCMSCTATIGCKRCDARMVYHKHPPRLHCHHCDARMQIPNTCRKCGENNFHPVGLGTQRLEQTLATYFPDIPIIRVDRDSTKKRGEMQALLERIHQEKKAILIGTQMLAKGHHFPNVTLVGMIDADHGLFSADFRAAEQMGQLLIQVAGRAGREEKPGTVAIQTRHPDHPLLQLLIQEGYLPFAKALLTEREKTLLPPYSYFAVFRAESRLEINANEFLNSIKNLCHEENDDIHIFGPVPALLAKRKGLYCQHLLLRTNKRHNMQTLLAKLMSKLEHSTSSGVKWVLDVDPLGV